MKIFIEHLIKQGVGAWNRWRRKNPGVEPDLDGVDLEGAELLRANFRDVSLRGANLQGANLASANFEGARLNWANVQGAKLLRADLRNADLESANLEGARLHWANFEGARLRQANLRAADLSCAILRHSNFDEARLFEADMHEADLSFASFKGAKIGEANLKSAILQNTNLEKANLFETELFRANLSHAILAGAYLERTQFKGATLLGANLAGAHLVDTDLGGVDLKNSNLSRANIDGAFFAEASLDGTILVDVDLSKARDLELCRHFGPSTIDHRTLQRSGALPLEFLRGVGLPDTLIDYLPSLLAQPFQFYSCFISYSAKDQQFADRLNADLQAKGVRCWFAPHDLPIGAKIWDSIDEAIRLRDKVLLILSEDSIRSEWVEDEVGKAFAEERDRSQLVLFPIRLDDAVMTAAESWARKLRDQRNIGNFTSWTNHATYKASFDRLMRDLTVQTNPIAPTGRKDME